jgi:hypothetical protein
MPPVADRGHGSNLGEVCLVPFHQHTSVFSPEELDMMTTALNAAMRELERMGVEVSQKEVAQRILDCTTDGVFDLKRLKRAALAGYPQTQLSSQDDRRR